ncbi:hypothetical protein [Streptomyces sp. VRA16 Mangrove soil]|uniref:hypothetical protein n=1 Tax=Streptomyces sp. VRA16 Mangrove soil TaxID=2817434 RepID=UPI001A9DDAF2|nr:hypothetical protein [Streptomyces sp. VRA16 Mangrove soil]MBO1330870.1 hypothetical protein [Streptomyces sp. VRA16 Mangrove soil]
MSVVASKVSAMGFNGSFIVARADGPLTESPAVRAADYAWWLQAVLVAECDSPAEDLVRALVHALGFRFRAGAEAAPPAEQPLNRPGPV